MWAMMLSIYRSEYGKRTSLQINKKNNFLCTSQSNDANSFSEFNALVYTVYIEVFTNNITFIYSFILFMPKYLITIRFPFNWKNPAGYLVAVTALLAWAAMPLLYIGCLGFLGFGAFMFALTFVEDMKGELRLINEMAIDKRPQREIYEKFSAFIRIHANVKQLSI